MGNKQQTQQAPVSKVVTFGQTQPKSNTYVPPHCNVIQHTILQTTIPQSNNLIPTTHSQNTIPPQLINKNHDIWVQSHNYINQLYVNQNDSYYEAYRVPYPYNSSDQISYAQQQVPNDVQKVLITNYQIRKSKNENEIPFYPRNSQWSDWCDDEEYSQQQVQVIPKQHSRRKPKKQTIDTKIGDTIDTQQQQPRQKKQKQPRQPQQQPQQLQQSQQLLPGQPVQPDQPRKPRKPRQPRQPQPQNQRNDKRNKQVNSNNQYQQPILLLQSGLPIQPQ